MENDEKRKSRLAIWHFRICVSLQVIFMFLNVKQNQEGFKSENWIKITNKDDNSIKKM